MINKEFFCKIKSILIPCRGNKYKPRFLSSKFLFYYAVALLLLKLAIMPFLFYFPQTAFFADLTKISLFQLANASREESGFEPLEENPVLSQAAYLKAKDMLEKDYFAHYSPEGITPWYWLEKSGYEYRLAGENLAIGFLESEQVHLAWMDSPTHKRNILNPDYQEMGIAVLKGDFQGRETALVVQFFGTSKTIIPEKEEMIELPSEIAVEEEVLEEIAEVEETIELAEEEEITEESVVEESAEEKIQIPIIAGEEKKEIISPATIGEIEKTPIFFLFEFMTSDYYNLLQKIIYGSLILIIISLAVTVFCDIFVYRKFEIDHRDAIFKTIGFSALWIVLLFLDKMIMVEIINPQHLMIYGV